MLLGGLIDTIVSWDDYETVFRPLGAFWLNVHAESLEALHRSLTAGGGDPWLWNSVLMPLLKIPTIIVFGCLALLFLAFAWLSPRRDRRRRRHDDYGHYERDRRDDDARYDRRRD